MPWRALLPVAVAVGLALLLSACGERSEPLGDVAAPFPVTVQSGETAVTVARQPQRLVAVDPGSADFLEALGAWDRLVGIPASSATSTSTAEVVVTATGRIQVAPISQMEPDLIVADDGTDPVELARLERQLGVPVYVRPSRTVDDVIRAAFDLGTLIGEPVNGRRLANDLRARVADVDRRLAAVASTPVFADMGFFETPLANSLFRDLLERGGGELVPAGLAGGLAASPAEIATAGPEVYFATSDSRVTLESLEATPALRAIPAVRDRRVVVLETADTIVAGPETVDVLEVIAAAIHPDVFG